jgi:acyl carrier protein
MSFKPQETFNSVVEIISSKLNIPKENITPQATFKDLGADSLDIADIIMTFEESFGVKISDQDAEKINTIEQAAQLIHQARTK